jgi:hypothetical protein
MGKIYLIKCYKNDNNDWDDIVIDSNVDEVYKIGFTRGDPNKRLKALQTGNPHRMELINQFETKFNTKLEANLHQQFKSKKIMNEWFVLDNNDVDGFIELCEEVETNYTFLSESNYHFRKLLNLK